MKHSASRKRIKDIKMRKFYVAVYGSNYESDKKFTTNLHKNYCRYQQDQTKASNNAMIKAQ